jgi:hypothetical protein
MLIVITKSGTRYRFVPENKNPNSRVLVYRQYAVAEPGWCRPDTHIATLSVEQVGFIRVRHGKSMNIPTTTPSGEVTGTILSTPVAEVILADCPSWLIEAL